MSSSQVQNRLVIDIADLPNFEGHSFGPSSWQQLSQTDVQDYANVSGDHNPIHVDPEAGAKSPFGQTVAHGYLTLSRVVPLMAEVFTITGFTTGVNYGLNHLRFPAPVPVDSSIRLQGNLKKVEEIAGGYQLLVDVVFEVQDNPKPACVAELVLRYYS